MRKLILLAGILLFLMASIIGYGKYRHNFQKVSFILKNPVGSMSLDVYKSSPDEDSPKKVGKKLKTITTTSTLTMKKGSYLLLPAGEHLDTSPLSLSVYETPVAYNVDVPYEGAYLSALAQTAQPEIHKTLASTYSNFDALYTVKPGKAFGRGEWYGTSISNIEGPELNLNGDRLYAVFKKEGSTWTLVSKPPRIILNAPDFPQVPVTVLRQINDM